MFNVIKVSVDTGQHLPRYTLGPVYSRPNHLTPIPLVQSESGPGNEACQTKIINDWGTYERRAPEALSLLVVYSPGRVH